MAFFSKYRSFLESIKNVNPVMKPIIQAYDIVLNATKSISGKSDYEDESHIEPVFMEAVSNMQTTKINWDDFKEPMVQHGVELMRMVNQMGYDAFVVGGAVRDIAMGDKNVHDIDIATNMPIDEIKTKFKTIEYGGGEAHGTVIVNYKGSDYELTQFRKDGDYSDGRRPDSVEFVNDFKEDAARRDFTINSMGIDVDGNIIDHHGGMDDLRRGNLRTVGDAEGRFTEDALRILRAVRFAARFDFKVDQKTLDAMEKLKHTVTTTSIERIRDELLKTIDYGGRKFGNALSLLNKTGLWDVIVPEVKLNDKIIDAVNSANTSNVRVNFSIIFNEMDAKQVDELSRRLKMTNDEIKSLVYIVSALPIYLNITQLSKQDALKLVSHPDFPLLRQTFVALNGQDINKADDIIENISNFKSIVDRQKTINQLIMDAGFQNAQFGNAVKTVNNWLFNEFEKGNTPSDTEVSQFIGTIK